MKKTIAIIISIMLVMVFTFPAAAITAPAAKSTPKLFSKTTEISMLTEFVDSWPIQDNWPVLKFIQDATNVKLKIVKQVGDPQDVIPPMLAAGTAPDILQLDTSWSLPVINDNAIIDFNTKKSEMPDFFKWINANKDLCSEFYSAGGQLYMAPQTDIGEANRMGWMFRKDIFDANKIKLPTNDTEFFNALKYLKALYPNSTPLVFRNNLQKLAYFCSEWNVPTDEYYLDRSTGTWKYGAIQDNYKTFVTFMNKLYVNKLIPQDFVSIDTKSWQERVSNSQGFVTFDYLTRIDGYNTAVRPTNPKFTLYYMNPFKGGANGTNKLQYTATNESFFGVYSESKNVSNAVKYINWLYTDQAKNLLSWGVEGNTYKVVNGQNKLVGFKDITDLRAKTGLSTLGMYGRFDYKSHMSLFSPELYYAYQNAEKNDQTPLAHVSFTEDENNTQGQFAETVKSYKEEQIDKFITGQRPLSQWNDYVSEIKKLGLDTMLKLYNTAYARQK